MQKILLIFGTIPVAIKMAPLVKEFQKYLVILIINNLKNE